jgi:hypothetical protein
MKRLALLFFSMILSFMTPMLGQTPAQTEDGQLTHHAPASYYLFTCE